jgi:hypothetical protein
MGVNKQTLNLLILLNEINITVAKVVISEGYEKIKLIYCPNWKKTTNICIE